MCDDRAGRLWVIKNSGVIGPTVMSLGPRREASQIQARPYDEIHDGRKPALLAPQQNTGKYMPGEPLGTLYNAFKGKDKKDNE